MSFSGKEDHSITAEAARKLTQNYRKKADTGSVKAGFFGKDTLLKILNQEKCVGIRYYYGNEDDGTPAIVLVGVNTSGNDLIDGELAERSIPCPPHCAEANFLNS